MDALKNETAFVLVTKLQLNSSDIGKHLDWLTQVMMLGVESTGCLSAEILPPQPPAENEWVLVQRFYTSEQVDAWQKSPSRQKLLDELTPYVDSKLVAISESMDPTYATWGAISVAVMTHVKKGGEKAYLAYERNYQSAQREVLDTMERTFNLLHLPQQEIGSRLCVLVRQRQWITGLHPMNERS